MTASLILGHRGASADAPENTMRAFRLALEQGADGVELDVQPSADCVPVVIHDDTLDRTTDGAGPVSALPWAEVSRLRSGGEPVPRLEEVAAWAAESGAWLNVEVKGGGIEGRVLDVLHRAGVLERTILSSFVPEIVWELRRMSPPGTRVYFLTERWDDEVRAGVRALGAGGVCLAGKLADDGALAEAVALGLPAVTWTVDEPERIAAHLRAGARAVITNRPAVGVAARRGMDG